jgi:hypothetical protein
MLAAMRYAALGLRIAPTLPLRRGYCTCYKRRKCRLAGEHRPDDFSNLSTTDPATLRRWFPDPWDPDNGQLYSSLSMSTSELPGTVSRRPPGVVVAMDHWSPQDSVVENAERLADAIAAALASPGQVTVSLKGLRGITSSFANVILARTAQEVGGVAARARVVFETDTELQREVLARSLEAVIPLE